MANINDNIRGKKLFKEGSSKQLASKGSDGEITVSKEISDDLASLTDVSDVFNDDGLYQINRFLIKQIEDLREDVEELHAFIKDAFGKDSSSAASQGAKGDTGAQGPAGADGTNGSNGKNGADGNSHLSSVHSIVFNAKSKKINIVLLEGKGGEDEVTYQLEVAN
jgi:hypothetical protein